MKRGLPNTGNSISKGMEAQSTWHIQKWCVLQYIVHWEKGDDRKGWKGRLEPLVKRHLEKFGLFRETKSLSPEKSEKKHREIFEKIF